MEGKDSDDLDPEPKRHSLPVETSLASSMNDPLHRTATRPCPPTPRRITNVTRPVKYGDRLGIGTDGLELDDRSTFIGRSSGFPRSYNNE